MKSRTVTAASLATALLLAACGGEEPAAGSGGTDASGADNLVASTVGAAQRDAMPGAELTRAKCASCHYLDKHVRKVGPSLKGIYGRKPSITGVPFEQWDAAALDAWLADPAAIKPRTFMAIPGIKSAEDRAAIIDYLKRL